MECRGAPSYVCGDQREVAPKIELPAESFIKFRVQLVMSMGADAAGHGWSGLPRANVDEKTELFIVLSKLYALVELGMCVIVVRGITCFSKKNG
jgi:hypothetical protein